MPEKIRKDPIYERDRAVTIRSNMINKSNNADKKSKRNAF